MTRKRLKTLEDRVSYRIARSKQNVFVREDFEDLGGYDQIGRALRLLQEVVLSNSPMTAAKSPA